MTARDWELPIKVAEIAQADADQRLATSNPSRFALRRNGVTARHLKGLSGVTPDNIRRALTRHGIAMPAHSSHQQHAATTVGAARKPA